MIECCFFGGIFCFFRAHLLLRFGVECCLKEYEYVDHNELYVNFVRDWRCDVIYRFILKV